MNSTTNRVYHESMPSVKSWIRDQMKNPQEQIQKYFRSFFPFLNWIFRYNFVWFWSDLIAGLTVGAVVIPQGMAYAGLAKLAPQFGLYSSFVGVMIYWCFATSKDITIGPVAVMSVLTGTIIDDIHQVHPQYELHTIASALCLLTGCFVCAFGLLRLGFLVDFISLPALSAFVTGSAINIGIGQIPTMMGNSKYFDTRQSTYLVFIDFWKNIQYCNLNAALGLSALILLYLIRFICNRGLRHYPQRERIFFFINTLRTVFVILLYLLISWLINRDDPLHPHTSILGDVPKGFQNMSVPVLNREIFLSLLPYLPSAIIVLLIEHIAIAKSFGRMNNYRIDPNQELIAIGVTNIFGPFFGAYPATGSFSRTAIKSKAGVRTPFAGLFTGIVILLAIYLLTPMFFWISQASLAAVIIHAVGDLIIGPQTLRQFWQVNPFEFFIFWIGVIVTIFSNIENGIYVSILASGFHLLYRLAKTQGQFLGRIEIHQIQSASVDTVDPIKRNIYVPLDYSDGTNPKIQITPPGNGIFIYRMYESFLYPNAIYCIEKLIDEIVRETKSGKRRRFNNVGEQPWNLDTNHPSERNSHVDDGRPRLHSIILDFTGVLRVDTTAIQNLVAIRRQLDDYADWQVHWHFVGLSSSWIKRALISHGFGSIVHNYHVFPLGNAHHNDDEPNIQLANDSSTYHSLSTTILLVPILDTDRPLFHVDLYDAYQSAVYLLSVRQNINDIMQ